MADFWGAFAWGLCVLAGLVGWGRGCRFLLDRQVTASVAWLEAGGWGIAAASLIGSLLNLFGLAAAVGLEAFVAVGILLAIAIALRDWTRKSPSAPRDVAWWALLLVLVALLFIRFAASVTVDSFRTAPGMGGMRLNPLDDMHSYAVSVERLLQTGTLGHDPFNSRMMMSALGTQHFLNALAIAPLELDHVHMAEGGIGVAALCGAAIGLGLRIGLRRRAATAVGLVPLMVGWWYLNISANATAAASLMVLFSSLVEAPLPPRGLWKWGVRIGFLLAAACSLKGTVIPASCLFVAASIAARSLAEKRPQILAAGTVALAATFLCLLPWMLWQLANSGTMLYPLLGRGDHAEALGVAAPQPVTGLPPGVAGELRSGIVLPLSLLLLMVVLALWHRRRTPRPVSVVTIAFLAAWTASWPVIVYATQTPDVARYLAPLRGVGLALFVAGAWRIGTAAAPAGRHWPRLGQAALAAAAIVTSVEWMATYFVVAQRDLSTAFAGKHLLRGEHGEIQARVRAMQAAVPPGEKLLVYLAEPAFLDFRRNPLYVADWPGETSLPPGMPLYAGPRAVQEYLLRVGIRYVAYSYARKANFAPIGIYKNYADPSTGKVLSRQARGSFLFQSELEEIARHCRIIFRNDEEEVIDLATPASSEPDATRP
jgi:hypothetical protein